MYGADLACGVDLFLEPDPAKYLRKGQPEAAEVRKELTFYDLWVARDIRGRRFQWAPPFALHVAPAVDAEEEAASAQRRYSKRKERCVKRYFGCLCLIDSCRVVEYDSTSTKPIQHTHAAAGRRSPSLRKWRWTGAARWGSPSTARRSPRFAAGTGWRCSGPSPSTGACASAPRAPARACSRSAATSASTSGPTATPASSSTRRCVRPWVG